MFLLLFLGCETIVDFEEPVFQDDSILSGTEEISNNIKPVLEGVYKVERGASIFGGQVVLKWARGKLSVFGARQGTYFFLNTGQTDSSFLFEGKWRHALSTETGLVRMKIANKTMFDSLGGNYPKSESFSIIGKFGYNNDPLDNIVQLTYLRPFSEVVKNSDFYILAHRAGGRNSDYVGASENSLEILPYAEHFGADGVEIDVKLSKDNIPFIYHDTEINLRLTLDSPIWGPIEDFTFKQLRSFVLLKNGERIPALAEMLLYIIEETNLRFVWLDMKSEKDAMTHVIKIQKRALEIAAEMNREIEIVIGLPTDDQLEKLTQDPDYKNIPSLCELSLDKVRQVNAKVWAPRWTLGTQLEKVREIQSEGRKVFTWTLDQAQFISEFIQEGEFDGILTNYPTIVAYFFIMRNKVSLKNILHIIFVLAGINVSVLAQGTDTLYSVNINAGLGYGRYVTALSKNYLDRNTFNFTLRLMWQPEHLLSVGIESGYVPLYQLEVDNFDSYYGTTDVHLELNTVPIIAAFSMRIIDDFKIVGGIGGVILFSTADYYENKVTSSSWSNAYELALNYMYPLFDDFKLGAELKWFYISKIEDSLLTLQLSFNYSIFTY